VPAPISSPLPPPADTLERWAFDYVTSVDLAHKLAPPPPPRALEQGAPARRLTQPGRPAVLTLGGARPRKTPSAEALRNPARRAELVHTFLHHELQAAELFCWALLAFPDTPEAFRRGLAAIAVEETEHLRLYAEHLPALGSSVGAFPVRDWFWERIPAALSPATFVAVMGIGFEGANLDHAERFAERFRAAGDARGAEIVERIGLDERGHVRFAIHWFTHFGGPLSFDAWRDALPRPLSPLLLRGKPLAREARLRAGLDAAFVDALDAWTPEW
jgi:uncharacterized ferritin-like protein (DUF455 family)